MLNVKTKTFLPSLGKDAQELFSITVEDSASDLHITVGQPPILRVAGQLIPLSKKPVVTKEFAEQFAFSLLTDDQKAKLIEEKEIDLSYSLGDKARFRGNIFYTMGTLSVALRLIPQTILTPEELNLPSVLHQLT